MSNSSYVTVFNKDRTEEKINESSIVSLRLVYLDKEQREFNKDYREQFYWENGKNYKYVLDLEDGTYLNYYSNNEILLVINTTRGEPKFMEGANGKDFYDTIE